MHSPAGQPIRTRFAPSPTGHLHLGHALAAKIARDLAKNQGNGQFFLRHEDIDGPRVREEFVDQIEEDLRWLGLLWDGEPLRQSSRTAAYETALATLRDRDLVYPCFCTRREIQEELARAASAPHGPSQGNYPGTCKLLSAAERKEKIAAAIPYAWRLDAGKAADLTGPLDFHDLRFGTIVVNSELLGDVILARKDIGTAYHLAVVMDDAFQEITHVTRGEDLLESTHVHRLLQAILGLPVPIYFHHRLMLDSSGKRLAKRDEAASLYHLRREGFTPEGILRQLE